MFGAARSLPAHDVELQRIVLWVLIGSGIAKASRRVGHEVSAPGMESGGVKSRDVCEMSGDALMQIATI